LGGQAILAALGCSLHHYPQSMPGSDSVWQDDRALPSSNPPRSTSPLERLSEPGGLSSYHAEQYDLSPDLEEWSRSAHRHRLRPQYRDGDTIDWWHEDASERERWKTLVSQQGLRGLISPFVDVTKLWFVIVFTGICVGLAGGWLDILVIW